MTVHGQSNLRNHQFPVVFNTSDADIIQDFFVPALSNSIRYDRGVGYFSAAWLRLAAEGMVEFASNSGRARWITSPILRHEDWLAMQYGEAAKHDVILRQILEQNVNDLETLLKRETLSALSWMIADGILEFKLALPRNKLQGGEFHDKFGIFCDNENNRISFNGSYNESEQGTRNYESIKIFQSWDPAFLPLVDDDTNRFMRIWNNYDPNVRVFDLPEAARAQILQLRSGDRPYKIPEWMQNRGLGEPPSVYNPSHLVIPSQIELRDYQQEAICAWFEHACQGLFEMATGTGKTITALAASVRLFDQTQRLAVVITVPYQHLVDQWNSEAKAFGYQSILAYQNKASWLNDLNNHILEFNSGYRKFISVITTHTTFISPDFQKSIQRIKNSGLIIADEAHHLGAERSRENYPSNIDYRLALSATPDRWFDDLGTTALRGYFGDTVFSFPLEKAIGISLTPYYYYPYLVSLTDDEFEHYQQLSLRIAQLMNRQDDDGQRILKMLLIRRAELLNKASNKIDVLSDLVDGQDDIIHTLFYCAPRQIDEVLKLLGWEKGKLVHRFTAEENSQERQRLLSDFARGNLQALVAMKCLDEGVDIPCTRTAYFLASSGNPREFIQRRGRILRKSRGKENSIIYDLIAVPPTVWNVSRDDPTFAAERSIVRHELQRFKEFSEPALNKYQALDVIWEIAGRYGLLDF